MEKKRVDEGERKRSERDKGETREEKENSEIR